MDIMFGKKRGVLGAVPAEETSPVGIFDHWNNEIVFFGFGLFDYLATGRKLEMKTIDNSTSQYRPAFKLFTTQDLSSGDYKVVFYADVKSGTFKISGTYGIGSSFVVQDKTIVSGLNEIILPSNIAGTSVQIYIDGRSGFDVEITQTGVLPV